MLQIPAVHVVEGHLVLILASHDSHRYDRSLAGSEQEHVPHLDLTREAPHESAFELLVVAFRRPRTSITRTNERDPVLDEDIGICARRRATRDLPYGWRRIADVHRGHRGTASNIASSRRFSSLAFG